MTRVIFAFALVAAAGSAAWADDTRVRTSATVEVLDDKAQIDDVISRMRTQQARDKKQPAPLQQAATLKVERPAPPTTTQDSQHRPVGPEPKEQRTGSRRVNLEHGSTNVTERPRLHRR
jgi:hypothetical protein